MPTASEEHVHAPLVIDVAGLALTDADRRRVANPIVGGLILFSRNWDHREQLTALCAEVKALRPDMLICVDHEGGRVQRFKGDGFTHLPPAAKFGEMWFDNEEDKLGHSGLGAPKAMDAATRCAWVMAAELRACGVDFSFAPVLDLNYGTSTVIGDRAFHRDPRLVTVLAKSFAHGMALAGMGNCGKHFPGHGFVRADSHTHMPTDSRVLRAILKDDALPYDWLRGTLMAVMPAHVVYQKVDERPAGFSRIWLHDVLRKQLGFQGCIFSDDLSMAGARKIEGREVGYAEAALAALAAGCDMVLLCNQSGEGKTDVDDLLQALSVARRRERWVPSARSEARRRALLPRGPAPTWDELQADPRYVADRKFTIELAAAANEKASSRVI